MVVSLVSDFVLNKDKAKEFWSG